MTNSLPSNPSLENLRKQSKTLQKSWHAGESGALSRVRSAHPKYKNSSDQELLMLKPRLTDCQLVLARENGFDSWNQMRVAIETNSQKQADQFVSLACLCYDDPHYDHRMFHVRAHEMLLENPGLASNNIWSAAASGNVAAVNSFLGESPELVNQPGPFGWVPLICACYSRVEPIDSSHSTLEVARLLLKRGANPNAYTMKGNADDRLEETPRRFTALTGAFGGGSTGLANQPPHPQWRALAEALLESGANPADEEALDHSRFDSNGCLELLLRYGLGPEDKNRRASTGDNGEAGSITLLGRELSRAVQQGQVQTVRLLLANGARTDEELRGKTPWQHAMARGNLEIASLLEDAGAPTAKLSHMDQFIGMCLSGDREGATALADNNPDLLKDAPRDMVLKAAETGREDAVNLVVDLGFDLDWMDDCAALHTAAWRGDEKMVALLLKRGASLTLREPWYDGTAVGGADFFDHIDLRDKLLNEGAIDLFDALDFDRLDRIHDILSRDPSSINRPFAECVTREPRPEDWQTPLCRMVVRGKVDAVRILLDFGGDATVLHPEGRTLLEVAREKGFDEIARMLEDRPASQ